MELGADLAVLWNHPEALVELKKRILRTVLHEVVVDSKDDPPEHRLQLHWAAGVHTQLLVRRNKTGQHRRSADRAVVDLVRDLAKVYKIKRLSRF